MSDEAALGLASFSDADLKAELARRQRERDDAPRLPAGRCDRCGAEWFFVGVFSASRFERQLLAFREAHTNCVATLDGGCI